MISLRRVSQVITLVGGRWGAFGPLELQTTPERNDELVVGFLGGIERVLPLHLGEAIKTPAGENQFTWRAKAGGNDGVALTASS